ncbi:ribonuclease T2 [Piromyces finnis]|uniref:ribonuclease T2 n=1 Tax=Piromyces finnis TaxID=1754191 RepID=A0A1Y1UWR2_9FUNG|nr:ribonuclease T2 [Piromyces finnis]|eukprot:ORX42066.1 ribonuclease T2 [Piromyces finnis]
MKRIIYIIVLLYLVIQSNGRVFDSQLLLIEKKEIECPSFDIVACSNNEGLVNKCCIPDQGHMVLALQWLPSYCKNAGRNKPCKKGTLKKVEKDTWTLHGLWPGNCDGKTYLTNCNPEREEENIEEIIRTKDEDLLSEMEKIWLSGNPDQLKDNNWFWAHEWNKHGQCVSTITPQCLGSNYKKDDDIITYFEKAVELRSIYDLYPILEKADIVPNDKEGYSLDTLQDAFKSAFNNTQVEINCVYNKREKRQYMSEVRLCFHAKNTFEVEGPINCINAFSRCNPKYNVFYAVNPTKPKIPKNPEDAVSGNNYYIEEDEDDNISDDDDDENDYSFDDDDYDDDVEDDIEIKLNHRIKFKENKYIQENLIQDNLDFDNDYDNEDDY